VTKKIIREALDQAAAGDLDVAVSTLRRADGGFVRRRLQHLMTSGPYDDRPLARTLWSIWAPEPNPMRCTPMAEIDEPEPSLMPALPARAPQPATIELGAPEPFLRWATAPATALRVDDLHIAELWGLVGLASLGNSHRRGAPTIEVGGSSGAARFAHALGLDRVLGGEAPFSSSSEPGRTVPLRQVRRADEILPAARDLASLIVRNNSAMRAALEYVFIELLRNVVQHSRDPLGGVVGAQVNDLGPHRARPVFQIAVADGGIGIPESLARMHRVTDVREALERSLWPHISGTFPAGLTGSGENAGLGLFFIAELAKLTVGRMMIATRGAALMLTERAEHATERVGPHFLEPLGVGFPGTLVAFELPTDSVADFARLTAKIQERARERTPARAVTRWIRFEPAPSVAVTVRVQELAEDSARAAAEVKDRIRPAILDSQPVAFDFSDIEICTQSFLHALLYETVRLAWATRTVLNATHAGPAVRSGIEFLERYALGG
jgi:hypothetical protein